VAIRRDADDGPRAETEKDRGRANRGVVVLRGEDDPARRATGQTVARRSDDLVPCHREAV